MWRCLRASHCHRCVDSQALTGDDVENVGYVIPTPVVHHFLNDYIRTGGFSGFPALGVQWQRMESDALRRSFKMKQGQKGAKGRGGERSDAGGRVNLPFPTTSCCAVQTSSRLVGVLIRNLNPTSDAATALKPDDVVMRFDGIEISNDGTVPFRTGERIAFSYLISNKYIGDECSLEVLRDGQALTLTVK